MLSTRKLPAEYHNLQCRRSEARVLQSEVMMTDSTAASQELHCSKKQVGSIHKKEVHSLSQKLLFHMWLFPLLATVTYL
jgi:hypothetical protein